MSNPNVNSIKRIKAKELEHNQLIKQGMLPTVPQSSHPSIIFRWGIFHIVAPGFTNRLFIWVDAWVVILFDLTGNTHLLSNAFTSLQENKPKILDLKIQYEEALASPEKQLVILTAYQLKYTEHTSYNKIAVDAAVLKTYALMK